MSHEVNIHAAQTSILRELLFHPDAGYAKLQKPTGLTSDHFNFHIARLVELGFVEKVSRGLYALTTNGKEFANRLDTDNSTIERQPKTAVILALRRERDGSIEYVFQERLKNPYYGYWGLPSGKIRWGETIVETARRESLEETGLDGDFEVRGVYHEHVIQEETGDLLEDKIFFVVLGTNMHGAFQADFEGGHNEWMPVDEALKKEMKFKSFDLEINILDAKRWLEENTVSFTKEQF